MSIDPENFKKKQEAYEEIPIVLVHDGGKKLMI